MIVRSRGVKVRETSCVSTGHLLNLSFAHFPYLGKSGNADTYLQGLL